MEDAVSIIIPIYNREALIVETLNSIVSQTYQNWQCIIVDDCSTDNTFNVLKEFVAKDKRFFVFQRPKTKPKGANACRNIGLEKAKGDYVVFFDSDDLMTPNHLEIKVKGIQEDNFDYVITKTKYFNLITDKLDYCYKFNLYELTPYNYVAQHINWLTLDVCIKRELAQSIEFNEALQSGQEYNYFSKLVHQSCKAKYIDVEVSLRRYHENSTRSQLNSKQKKNKGRFLSAWLTYKDLKPIAEKRTSIKLIKNAVVLVYDSKAILTHDIFFFKQAVFSELGIKKGIYFLLMLISLKTFNKGYWFKKQIQKEK
tara:strand:- start:135805 stop:136740 length:936 start_codon:yes stop_codon:yes gene_type:complete